MLSVEDAIFCLKEKRKSVFVLACDWCKKINKNCMYYMSNVLVESAVHAEIIEKSGT